MTQKSLEMISTLAPPDPCLLINELQKLCFQISHILPVAKHLEHYKAY